MDLRARIVALAAALLATLAAAGREQEGGETVRPVYSAYQVAVGSAHVADTYLTPIRYEGMGFGFDYHRSQAMKFDPEHWVMQLRIGANASLTQNMVKNADLLGADISGSWAMMRRWRLPGSVTLGIGPGTSLSLGALYLSRNSNNPVSAKASWTVDARGFVSWRHRLGRMPLMLSYQADLALLGAFFSPHYGQLYYQIYLGDRKGLARCAWPGNFFSLGNLVAADMTFGATTLRLGYRCDILSTKASGIVSRHVGHELVVGICTEWISLRPGKAPSIDKIISAY